jgi:hypothetical protein
MSGIDVAAVMTGLAEALTDGETPVLTRAYDWPTLDVEPPALIVGYPETGQPFDATMRRGADRATFPAWIVCGVMDKRSSRDVVAAYILPAKTAWEDATGPWESLRVTTWGVDAVNVGGLDYVAAKFEIDVLT